MKMRIQFISYLTAQVAWAFNRAPPLQLHLHLARRTAFSSSALQASLSDDNEGNVSTPSVSVDDAVVANGAETASNQNQIPSLSSAIVSHHVAIKTRNIENAIKFYSLLGFRVESKFVAGPARAAWLLHESSDDSDGGPTSRQPQSRIELLEVPSYMLNESEGTIKRAIDLTKREELLGLNHLALDVTRGVASIGGGGDEPSSSCQLYQLQEYMDDIDALSMQKFGKTLRVALPPTKRIIGREVYEMAFIYDADGSLIELLNHSGTLQQDMITDGWEPWDGKGFVQ